MAGELRRPYFTVARVACYNVYTDVYMNNSILNSLVNKHQLAGHTRERKQAISIRLSTSVLEFFKSQGTGYQSRINDLLTDYVRLAQEMKGDASLSVPGDDAKPLTPHARVALAQSLFQKFYIQCFWHLRLDLEVKEAHIPMIIAGLQRHGGRAAFIEASKLCR